MPCSAEGGAQDEDGCVVRPVNAVLQGLGRRLTHPLTLPYLTISHGRGAGEAPLPKGERRGLAGGNPIGVTRMGRTYWQYTSVKGHLEDRAKPCPRRTASRGKR
ncbi:hypothetical protein GCM10010387_28150 [Streptomyces inusitatus]|uniref:Uncharacterized protein n=1 Tax=Streptomyces inusitatus TaxID=68221 RepID=A0A918USR4_9ACTN|nr:hypothetical protein GCM10010387_28150 [Streptomyces inusitatus]